MANLDPFVKAYLIGAAVSLFIQLIYMLTSPRVTVKMLLGYILNTALSWGCIATLIMQGIVAVIEKKKWNKVLWTTGEYKEYMKKLEKGSKTVHGVK